MNWNKILVGLGICLILNCGDLAQLIGGDRKPTFNFQKVDIASIDLSEITLNMLTSVKNPYPVSLPRSDLDLKLSIEDMPFTSSKIDLGKIEANSEKPLPFPIKLKYADLLNLYKKFPSKELLKVKLDGLVGIPIPQEFQLTGKKSLEFPFSEGRDVPSVLPTIDIRNFKIIKPDPAQIASQAGAGLATQATSFLDNLLSGKKPSAGSAAAAGLSGIDLNVDTEFDLGLKNLAASKLNFQDLNYDLSLKGEKFLSGKSADILNNGLESIVKVKTSFPLKSLSSGITDAITKKSSDFKLTGNSGLAVPGISESIKFNYDKAGSFKW
ncbi:MAG: LEA type 2 family protein [Leptospiraceae bacterium]|nr:LEA type 2 family protein [Leptospiraceae bacterium]